jgi:hypothetical protein
LHVHQVAFLAFVANQKWELNDFVPHPITGGGRIKSR